MPPHQLAFGGLRNANPATNVQACSTAVAIMACRFRTLRMCTDPAGHEVTPPRRRAAATASTSEQTPQTQACSTRRALEPFPGTIQLSCRVPTSHDGTATNSARCQQTERFSWILVDHQGEKAIKSRCLYLLCSSRVHFHCSLPLSPLPPRGPLFSSACLDECLLSLMPKPGGVQPYTCTSMTMRMSSL
jgi:hypothetical protein